MKLRNILTLIVLLFIAFGCMQEAIPENPVAVPTVKEPKESPKMKYFPDKNRPYFTNAKVIPKESDQKLAAEAMSYSDEEWLALLPDMTPTQANRALLCVHCGSANHWKDAWKWDPKSPNSIECAKCGHRFPSAEYPYQYEVHTSIMGQPSKIAFVENPAEKRKSYIKARINCFKTDYLPNAFPAMAKMYLHTKDEAYARRIILGFNRMAERLPHYVVHDYYDGFIDYDVWCKKGAPVWASLYGGFSWNALEMPMNLVEAYDIVYDSPSFKLLSEELGYDLRENIEQNFFGPQIKFLTETPMPKHMEKNLAYPYVGTAMFGIITRNSRHVAWAQKYLQAVVDTALCYDGMYPESFDYHEYFIARLQQLSGIISSHMALLESGKEDNGHLAEVAKQLQERLNQARNTGRLANLPNGQRAPIHDTWSRGARPNSSKSSSCHFIQGFGHLVLGDLSGKNQIQTHLHFSDFDVHAHRDTLSLLLYADEKERLSDIGYSRIFTRYWSGCSASHNLVMVDKVPQHRGRDVPTGGNLTLYVPNYEGISIGEAHGERAYEGSKAEVSRYQRMVILNAVEADHPYVLDIFCVKGGQMHDYILHGDADVDQDVASSTLLEKMDGDKPLLDKDEVWKEPTHMHHKFLSYGMFREVSKGVPAEEFTVDFLYKDKTSGGIRMHCLNPGGSELYLCRNPAMRGANSEKNELRYDFWRRNMIIRRKGKGEEPLESLFVSVLEPYKTNSVIKQVARIPVRGENAVGVEVAFSNGRVDKVLVNLNDSLEEVSSVDGSMKLNGRVGLMTQRDGKEKAYLFGGSAFKAAQTEILNAPGQIRGIVMDSTSVSDTNSANTFVTKTNLPTAGTLNGCWIILTAGELNNRLNQKGFNFAFEIESVTEENGLFIISTKEDHGLVVDENTVRELYRPKRIFTGKTKFVIHTNAVK